MEILFFGWLILSFGWLILSFVVANMGSSKTIGWISAFLISLFFSPLIGLLVVIASTPVIKNEFNKKASSLSLKASKKFEEGKYAEAGGILQVALELEPKSPTLHFNLATVYSEVNYKNEAYFHLSKSIENGYKNLENIRTNNHLNWLRQQPDYISFVRNGYKIVETSKTESNYLDELKELANLKELGVLTEEEFLKKKTEILTI